MQRHDRHDAFCGGSPSEGLDRRGRLASLGPASGEPEAIAAKILICAPAAGNDRLKAIFDEHACVASVAQDLPKVLRALKSDDIDVVVLEYPIGDGSTQSAVRAVENIKDCAPATEVVLYHSSDVSVSLADYCELIVAGARSFINEESCGSAAELARRIRDCATIKRRNKQREIELDEHCFAVCEHA